jgi:hypothetical protein
MVIKSAIVTLGAILELSLCIPGQGIFDVRSRAGVKRRVDRAHVRGWIDDADRDELKALWERRMRVHLRELDSHEFGMYRAYHVNKSKMALRRLLAVLCEEHMD